MKVWQVGFCYSEPFISDVSMLDDDDDFCDISEYERQDLQPFMQITAQLPFRTPAVSEESLKEDIEKVCLQCKILLIIHALTLN